MIKNNVRKFVVENGDIEVLDGTTLVELGSGDVRLRTILGENALCFENNERPMKVGSANTMETTRSRFMESPLVMQFSSPKAIDVQTKLLNTIREQFPNKLDKFEVFTDGEKVVKVVKNGREGVARCHEDDGFDLSKGIQIALARANGDSVDELIKEFYGEVEEEPKKGYKEELEVGDVVRIRGDLKEGYYETNNAVSEMVKLKGKEATIVGIRDFSFSPHKEYRINIGGTWNWTRSMFEDEIIVDNVNDSTKEDESVEGEDGVLKVGDVVTIREDLEHGEYYGGVYFASNMQRYRGEKVVIENISESSFSDNGVSYDVSGNSWCWSKEMFVDCKIMKEEGGNEVDETSDPTKEVLIEGDMVIIRDDLDEDGVNGVVYDMLKYRGKKAYIERVYGDDIDDVRYKIDIDDCAWWWSPQMFVSPSEEEIKGEGVKVEFKVGDKVKIPTTKGAGSDIQYCNAIIYAKEKGQDFLYINDIIHEDGIFVAWHKKEGSGSGDFFLECDLGHYEEIDFDEEIEEVREEFRGLPKHTHIHTILPYTYNVVVKMNEKTIDVHSKQNETKTQEVVYDGRTTTVIINGKYKGVARCNPIDELDKQKGYDIAYHRAEIERQRAELEELIGVGKL